MIELNKIYTGDALAVLKSFPDEIANCCVTSPPYWGLRAYNTNPVVWDGDKNCPHEWSVKVVKDKRGTTGSMLDGRDPYAGGEARVDKEYSFCPKCGAWRGELGAEPTPELFVQHIVQIFREVKRVLRDDGVLFLNLGDTYWGGKGQSGQAWSTEHQDRNTLNGNQHQISGMKETRPQDGKHDTIKPKDLVGIPWLTAFALRVDGWYLRSDIIWYKRNPMPESVTDRPTKSHEYIFLLSKNQSYYYDAVAIAEPCVWDIGGLTEQRISRADENHKAMPSGLKNGIRPRKKGPQTFGGKKARDGQANGGDIRNGHRTDENSQWGKVWESEKPTRNKRSVWVDEDSNALLEWMAGNHPDLLRQFMSESRNKKDVWDVATKPFFDAHYATYPQDLIVDCIKAGCPIDGVVLDPFMGAGTTGLVARKLNRNYIGIELNPANVKMSEKRLYKELGMFA